MSEQTVQVIVDVLVKLVIPALLAIVVKGLTTLFAKWNADLEQRMGRNNYTVAVWVAESAVRATEQIAAGFGLDTSDKKKAFAVQTLEDICEHLGIPLVGAQINALIEAAVQELNGNKKPELPVITLSGTETTVTGEGD